MPDSKSPRDPESAAAAQSWQDSALGPQGGARRAPMSRVPERQSECGKPRVQVENNCSPTSIGCAMPPNWE